MPFKEEMSWDASKKRWHRMHKGTMYRVPASQLGPIPTRDATRQAANEWWHKKYLEIEGPLQKDEIEEFVDNILDGPPEGDSAEAHELADELMTGFVGVQTYKKAVEALEVGLARPAKISERSVKACGQLFLEIVKGDIKPMSYREIKWYIEQLPNQDADVAIFDEPFIDRKYLELRNSDLSETRKKKLWGFFKRFIKFLWERRLVEMPRNLNSHTFTVRPQKIKTYTPQEVRKVLDKLRPRQKLYGLLALNCACNNVDIGTLKKSQIDLAKGTLTRKRVKTADNPNVPEVKYKLWPETIALLKECWSEHPELALTSKDNTPLWTARIEGDKTPRKDLILKQWRKAKSPISLKAFRSVAASLIESHPTYGRCTPYFLGHSPRSVKDKHYAAPPQKLFDEAMTWLHDRLFTCEGEKSG